MYAASINKPVDLHRRSEGGEGNLGARRFRRNRATLMLCLAGLKCFLNKGHVIEFLA